MADYVDVFVSGADRHKDGLLRGNPSATLRLYDDSNSSAGIPDDWNSSPDLSFTEKGALIVVVANVEVDVWVGYNAEDTPDVNTAASLRPAASGVGSYAFYAEDGRNHLWVRRAARA